MKRKTFISTTAILLLLCSALFCHAQDFSKIDDWLNANTGAMGGRSVLMIYKDGKIVYANAVNKMNMRQKMVGKMIARRMHKDGANDDYTTTSRVSIASCSKWLSAALVMTFVDEGKLRLDDTVGKYLPVLTQHGKGNITIDECLSHRTGIKEPPLKESLAEMKDINSMDEAIEKIAEMPMEGEPGKVFHYSNAGLQIAGAVIEKISGKDFKTLFLERIAQPLGMAHTDFGSGKVPLPAGGAISTTEDYMNFLEMILHKGIYKGQRILSEKSIAEMQVNRITPEVRIAYSPAEAGDAGYGYGEWVWDNARIGNLSKAVTSPGLFGSFPWVDNEKHYCAFLMTFYLKSDGRNERYKALKALTDEALQ
ncbi:MAG TPA: serine hydrolase domain-containing protein [Chitinophagaceae bacterium]|nr:serine hydrolase domain-containing protein [Chitinophagaceae bacterium]